MLKHNLNLVVMEAIGLASRTDELEEEVSKSIELRVGEGGEKKDIMVESPRERHV